MKKRFALFLVISSMLAMTSCGTPQEAAKEKTAYELYTTSNEAMNNAESLLMDTSIDMNMDSNGETMDISMTGSIAEVIRSETDIDMKLDMATSAAGQEFQTIAYYKDGVYYMEMMGQKYKMPMPLDDIMKQANTKAIDFPETALKNQAVKDVDGGKELSFTLDGAAMNNIMKEQLGGMDQMLGANSELTFGDIDLTAVLDKDGKFTSIHMIFSFDMTVEGEQAKANCDITMSNIQIGGVTIEFPDDLDTYVDLNAQQPDAQQPQQ